jgi:hypothetical protein
MRAMEMTLTTKVQVYPTPEQTTSLQQTVAAYRPGMQLCLGDRLRKKTPSSKPLSKGYLSVLAGTI